MNYVPIADNREPMLTKRGISWTVALASMGGGSVVALLGWFGLVMSSPGQRMHQIEQRQDSAFTVLRAQDGKMGANRFYTAKVADSLRQEIGAVGKLLESTTTKSCLDAEASRTERNKLALSGVPCDSLYRLKGIRP